MSRSDGRSAPESPEVASGGQCAVSGCTGRTIAKPHGAGAPRHGVGYVDKFGIECLCRRSFEFGSGGWVAFNAHLDDVISAARSARA